MAVATAVERLEAIQVEKRSDKDRAKEEALNILVLAANPRVRAAYQDALERISRLD